MDFSNEIAQFTQGLQNFTAEIKRAFQRKRSGAFSADDASQVAGVTRTQLTANLRASYDAHVGATNPHNDTAALLGIYDSAAMDNILANLVPSGILPVSYWKRTTLTGNTSTFVITFGATTAIISGKVYAVPQTALDLSAGDPSPGSKTYCVYAQLKDGEFTYVSIPSTSPIAESDVTMYIGQFQCSSGGILNQDVPTEIIRLDNYRLSTTAKGSSIPVSNGYPSGSGTLAWT